MSDITLNTQSITGNHNFVPPGTDWNLGSGSKKWNGGYFGTIIADAGIPAGTAATGGDKIGQIRFSINPNIEPGYLALNGQEVNREDYPNLWAWVQQQVGFLIEESEWQGLSTAHNGNVGKYSVGNGTTTFRLPNLGCWVRGGGTAGTANGVGGNLDAGLPNIMGTITSNDGRGLFGSANVTVNGAFSLSGNEMRAGNNVSSTQNPTKITLNASLSNSIYGNSDTIQPESIIGIWLVKAYHVPVDNMGNTITVNGVPPDENGNISIEVPQPTIATQEEAEAGTDNTKFMTPLRVKQAIDALTDSGIVSANIAQNGYVKFADGVIFQWGLHIPKTNGWQTVKFNLTFTNKCFVCFALITNTTVGSLDGIYSATKNVTKSTFDTYTYTGGYGDKFWFAIGY